MTRETQQNIVSHIQLFTDEQYALEFCVENGLIESEHQCHSCQSQMSLIKRNDRRFATSDVLDADVWLQFFLVQFLLIHNNLFQLFYLQFIVRQTLLQTNRQKLRQVSIKEELHPFSEI